MSLKNAYDSSLWKKIIHKDILVIYIFNTQNEMTKTVKINVALRI